MVTWALSGPRAEPVSGTWTRPSPSPAAVSEAGTAVAIADTAGATRDGLAELRAGGVPRAAQDSAIPNITRLDRPDRPRVVRFFMRRQSTGTHPDWVPRDRRSLRRPSARPARCPA